LLIPALFLYVLSTGMKASALRAFTMAAIYFAAPMAGRRPDAPSSVALAAIVLLLINPFNMTDPGFQLSFIVVCGILIIHNWVSRKIKGLRFAGWDRPLRQLSSPHPAAGLFRSTGLLMITSLAAWLFSAPITARFFNALSPVALVGNLAVIPLTFMIMLTGSLALLSGAVFLPAAELFNLANISEVPGAGVPVPAPSGWVAGLWFAGLTLCFAGPSRWRKSALLMFLSSVLLWRVEQLDSSRGIRILRAGDAALAICLPEQSRWILVTDGSSYGTSRARRLLQKEGVSRIHTLVMKEGSRSEEIRQLQERFRPQQTVYEDPDGWAEGAGMVRISGGL
jgi:ComEC/Rec2-related protein